MFKGSILKKIKGKKKSLIIKFLHFYYSQKENKEIIKLINNCNKLDFNTSTIYDLWINYFILRQVVREKIEGDIVECGIWKGISLVFFKKILNFYNIENKRIYGYDTFEGFPEPGKNDFTSEGQSMKKRFDELYLKKDSSNWNYCSLIDVKKNLISQNIDLENIELIKGKTEETIINKENVPQKISILKLDTCLYDSTKIELEILFPKIQKGGVLIIDNFNNFKGVQVATNDYFKKKNYRINHNKLSGQIMIKV